MADEPVGRIGSGQNIGEIGTRQILDRIEGVDTGAAGVVRLVVKQADRYAR